MKLIVQLRQGSFYSFTVTQFSKGRIKGLGFYYVGNKLDGSPLGCSWYGFSRRHRPSRQISFLWLLHLLVKFGCLDIRNHKSRQRCAAKKGTFQKEITQIMCLHLFMGAWRAHKQLCTAGARTPCAKPRQNQHCHSCPANTCHSLVQKTKRSKSISLYISQGLVD